MDTDLTPPTTAPEPKPKLDWVPRHDPRSRSFAIRSVITRPTRRTRRWTPGAVLDQGWEGACVGFAWTGEAIATPVRVDLRTVGSLASNPGLQEPNALARQVYRNAQLIDEWEGESYEGTSVLAGAKVLTNLGLIKEYRWAFGVEDVIDTLILRGPVVLGTYWFDSMYEAPGGVLEPAGPIVGGHAYLATAYNHQSSNPAFLGTPTITVRNSWGPSWGVNGSAEIRVAALGDLLRLDGEACVPYRRSYGR